jgi:hypothetical protein
MGHFDNPFRISGSWIRAGLHCHTTNSDGGLSVQETISRHRSLGYHCVCITDHRNITRAQEFSTEDLVVIDSVEVGGMPDVIGIGAEISPDPNFPLSTRVSLLHQQGAFTVAAHPTYCAALPGDYLECEGLDGIEVYNAYCEEAYANGIATEIWDILLGEGKRIWGVASDDAHLNPRKRYYSDAGRAWVEIWVPELSREDILSSLKQGAFYSTQGPRFNSIDVSYSSITISCTPVQQIRWRTRGSTGFVEYSEDSRGLRESKLPEWFKPRGYVRIELVDPQDLKAWSNPLYFLP